MASYDMAVDSRMVLASQTNKELLPLLLLPIQLDMSSSESYYYLTTTTEGSFIAGGRYARTIISPFTSSDLICL